MRHDGWRSFARVLEWTLFAAGVVLLGQYLRLTYQSEQLESENRNAVARMLAERGAEPPSALSPEPSAAGEPSAFRDPSLIGELDIPRLRMSAAVRVGDDPDVLAGAVGYLPDTALPWEDGNSAFAAHRDRLFRALAKIRIGDEILLSTRHGHFQYRVSHLFIVEPDDVWVLGPAPGVDLTLITCYPFVYVGHAPHRFVVRAQKVQTAQPLRVMGPRPDVEREGDE